MNAKQINKEWGDKFIAAFNAQDAAIVFAIALTKEGKIRVCATTDLHPDQMKKILKQIIIQHGG